MNFKQILESLIAGKKIRRKCWEEGHYYFIDKNSKLVNSINETPQINRSQLEANDWEVLHKFCTECGREL